MDEAPPQRPQFTLWQLLAVVTPDARPRTLTMDPGRPRVVDDAIRAKNSLVAIRGVDGDFDSRRRHAILSPAIVSADRQLRLSPRPHRSRRMLLRRRLLPFDERAERRSRGRVGGGDLGAGSAGCQAHKCCDDSPDHGVSTRADGDSPRSDIRRDDIVVKAKGCTRTWAEPQTQPLPDRKVSDGGSGSDLGLTQCGDGVFCPWTAPKPARALWLADRGPPPLDLITVLRHLII